MIILDTRGKEESVETIIDNLKKEVAAVDGAVSAAENLGQRDFIRVTDRKFPGSVYVKMELTGPATLPAALRERVRLNKTVYRILVERSN